MCVCNPAKMASCVRGSSPYVVLNRSTSWRWTNQSPDAFVWRLAERVGIAGWTCIQCVIGAWKWPQYAKRWSILFYFKDVQGKAWSAVAGYFIYPGSLLHPATSRQRAFSRSCFVFFRCGWVLNSEKSELKHLLLDSVWMIHVDKEPV